MTDKEDAMRAANYEKFKRIKDSTMNIRTSDGINIERFKADTSYNAEHARAVGARKPYILEYNEKHKKK